MALIEESIEINAPVEKVYGEWSDISQFPKILSFVKEVTILDPQTSYWKLEIAGQEKEYEALLKEHVENSIISWSSLAGVENAGKISFEPTSPNRTRIDLEIYWEPEGALENIGDFLGIVENAARRDLQEFKNQLETQQ